MAGVTGSNSVGCDRSAVEARWCGASRPEWCGASRLEWGGGGGHGGRRRRGCEGVGRAEAVVAADGVGGRLGAVGVVPVGVEGGNGFMAEVRRLLATAGGRRRAE